MNKEVLISVVSWEERFLFGIQRLLTEDVARVVLFSYTEYHAQTSANRDAAIAACREKGIEVDCYPLSFQGPVDSWKQLFGTISSLKREYKNYNIEITTMPRETIWIILNLLDGDGFKVRYTYNEPEKYNSAWLSRDPGKPRIVFKLGGVTKLGAPNALVLITGFDPERVKHLIDVYEPEKTYLGMQLGSQHNNIKLNVEKHRMAFEINKSVEFFDIDAYNRENSYQSLKLVLEKLAQDHNVIMSSLGPKLSAIDLYRIHKEFENTALAYAPSNEFNPDYSKGIGEAHSGLFRDS